MGASRVRRFQRSSRKTRPRTAPPLRSVAGSPRCSNSRGTGVQGQGWEIPGIDLGTKFNGNTTVARTDECILRQFAGIGSPQLSHSLTTDPPGNP